MTGTATSPPSKSWLLLEEVENLRSHTGDVDVAAPVAATVNTVLLFYKTFPTHKTI